MNQNNTALGNIPTSKAFIIFVFFLQMWFGAWFVIHGLNYFVEFFVQPPGQASPTRTFIGAMIAVGLFDVIKVAEVVIGVLLLLNRFVPLAVLAAVPINGSIIWINLIANTDFYAQMVGIIIILVQALMIFAYFPYYRTILSYKAEVSGINGVKL